MARTAASIEYETASPPAGLPDDMQALPGASLRFLSIKAIDGFKVQAALWQTENRLPAETTMIVEVHGSGGNLASLPIRALARGLSAKGFVSRASPVQTAVRNCTRDEGGPFGFGDQVADPKPPQAAVVKSHGGERCGNAGTMIPAGTVERGERKRTVSEVSKAD